MSAAVAPLASKMLIGAVAGKVVGKVTGNDKLGMIAGLAAGAMAPGTVTTGVVDPVMSEPVTNAAGEVTKAAEVITPGSVTEQSTMGAMLDKGKGLLTSAGNFAKENPYAAIIGAQTASGLTNMYMEKQKMEAEAKEAEKQRQHQMATLAEQEQQNIRTYDREHQDWTPRAPSTYGKRGGLLSANAAPGSDYYQQYLQMYGGVR